jgi:NAD(P)-dependent dehydrogenase (short-subunit alcohol dehydrogenase family)
MFGSFICARETAALSTAHGGTGGSLVNVSSAAARQARQGGRGLRRGQRGD